MNKLFWISLILFLIFYTFTAQSFAENISKGVTLSGHIYDKENGESLPGATVYVSNTKSGTSSNNYGFYSMTLPVGSYHVVYSFLGYNDYIIDIELHNDTTLTIEMVSTSQDLNEVEVTGFAKNENVVNAQMSVNSISAKTIASIPSLMGEVDLIKALQLLPDVKFVAEGSSGLSVRGGGPDQNLILLDEATIYNAGHLMGFFSVFNNDAVKSVDLYKGDLPAKYGGRLASMIDVRMKDGNTKGFHGNGGIGLISSRLLLEGPVVKDKVAFMVAGRRSYADLFLRLSPDEDINSNILYFYDLNMKVNYNINGNNHLYLSGYFGKDVFKSGLFGMNWGNATGTVRWNHIFNKKLFSNLTFVASRFNYQLGVSDNSANGFDWQSSLDDYNLRQDFQWFANPNNLVTFGYSTLYHNFFPGVIQGTNKDSFITKYQLNNQHALESAVFISNEHKLGALFILKYGFRVSMFNNIGSATNYQFDSQGNVADSTSHGAMDFYNSYTGFEPRLGIVFLVNESSSVKGSYSKNHQYIQQAQNSTAGSPLHIWFPSSPNVKPQIGHQFALGYFRNFRENVFETSIEVYYKYSNSAIDYRDHADLLLNKYFEGELLFGKSWGYGVELMVKKNSGKLTGWLSYTLSKSLRKINGINDGNEYPSPYDRPNDISLVMNYDLNTRVSFGFTWVYSSGNPVTFPVGRFDYDNTTVPIYSKRNSYRMPDYHRLDLSITWREKYKPEKKWHSEFNVSVYNAYNRKNPYVINFQSEPDNPNVTYAESTYLFGIIPSFTYNFKF